MSEARAKQITFVIDEYLRLVFEPAKRRGMDDAVSVALEFRADLGRRLGKAATARHRVIDGVRR